MRKSQRALSHRGGGTRGGVRTTVEWDKLLAFLGLFPPRVIRGPPQRWVWPVSLDPLSYSCVFLVGNDASRTWRAWYEWEKMGFLGRSWVCALKRPSRIIKILHGHVAEILDFKLNSLYFLVALYLA